MTIMDQKIAQKPMGDMDKFEVFMAQMPPRHYMDFRPT
jgi:hypothetical protein